MTPGAAKAAAPTAAECEVLDHATGVAMLDQVLAWSVINSGSRNLPGLETMAETLASAFAALPGTVELLAPGAVSAIEPNGREAELAHGRNLLVTVRPEAPTQLLLTGHMDTVFGPDSPFRTWRWQEPGILNGPGVADMKGGIAVLLAALCAFERHPDRRLLGYQVVINADEEVGSLGSADLLRRAAAGKQAALTYEPATLPDGTLAGARPGSGNFSIVVTGRSAHAGRNPEDGRNAIVAAADIVVRLSALVRPGLLVNCARIDGGGPNNVVPDRAVVRVNMRPATAADQADAERSLAGIVAEASAGHDVQIHVHGGFNRPPKPLDGRSEQLFRLVRECGSLLGQDIGWRDTGGVCDGNNIAACGVPVVDTMGVRGGAIHSSDEYLITDSLGERAALSALLLCRLAQGALPSPR